MNLKTFFQKNWLHFVVLAIILIVSVIYFKPQIDGYGIKQHDVEQWKGMAHETELYREQYGKEPLWTNSMFGGMPTAQITLMYSGNIIKEITNQYFEIFPGPIGILILHLIGFYILSLFLKINPLIGLIGAIAFSFASYEIIIIQAGHVTKSLATAVLPAILGAFIYAYRTNRIWGILFSSLFMTIELGFNHIQVTYYFVFLLIFVGFYFLYKAISDKQLKPFFITTAGLIGAFLVAFVINIGNIALTADYAKSTIRGGNDVSIEPDGSKSTNQTEGLDKDYITQWSYGIGETVTLMSPNVKGGGSFAIGGSQFEETLENTDLTASEKNELKNFPAYWGEQPFTSGPVYLGIVVLFLAFLGLLFLKTKLKWALFAMTVLAIVLSWGKNFMGLTNFFIDNVPGYNKFRTVTIILVIVELCIPLLGVLFLDKLLKEREAFKEKKKIFLYAMGGFFIVVFAIKMIGLGDNYSSSSDKTQLAGIEGNIRKQLATMNPVDLQTQYNLNVNDPAQVDEFVKNQAEPYYKNFDKLKVVREAIFNESMNRSLAFIFFTGLLLLLFLYTSIPTIAVTIGIMILTLVDMVPVAHNYLGDQEEGNKLKYWEEVGLTTYPTSANAADEQILAAELTANPSLKSKIASAEIKGKRKADELGFDGLAKRNVIESYKYGALNFATNYRVFDLNGAFQSSRASYFHKSLGGYHGAKLRSINNLFNFHLSKMNNKVYDMLNVKYFMQKDDQGVEIARPNPTALGNAWFVNSIEKVATPNDEIRALGSQFKLINKGTGELLVNLEPQSDVTIFGGEKLQYLVAGMDTIEVPLSNGLKEGMEAMFVMDARGTTNLVPISTMSLDTAKSFKPLVAIKVTKEFSPNSEAVVLNSEAKNLSKFNFSGEGNIQLLSYAPNKLIYNSTSKSDQFAVFSEIYYNDGWKAFVDGKEQPIVKVNYLLRGLQLTPGKHKIEFVFDLPKFHKANTIALIGSILLIIGFAVKLVVDIKAKMAAKK